MRKRQTVGDMGEVFRAYREASRKKRQANREKSKQLLKEAGIEFTEHNFGAHLIVCGKYNLWPGTGLWQKRGGGVMRRGVFRLIQHIQSRTQKFNQKDC